MFWRKRIQEEKKEGLEGDAINAFNRFCKADLANAVFRDQNARYDGFMAHLAVLVSNDLGRMTTVKYLMRQPLTINDIERLLDEKNAVYANLIESAETSGPKEDIEAIRTTFHDALHNFLSQRETNFKRIYSEIMMTQGQSRGKK